MNGVHKSANLLVAVSEAENFLSAINAHANGLSGSGRS